MSQAKVDKYKEEKKNRKKILKRKKIKKVAAICVCACLVGAAIGYPTGKHLYKKSVEARKAKATISADSFDYWQQLYWEDNYYGTTGLSMGESSDATDTDATASDADATTTDAE